MRVLVACEESQAVTKLVEPIGTWVQTNHKSRSEPEKWKLKGHRSAKIRSKTFPGIARAMAQQWAGDVRKVNQYE